MNVLLDWGLWKFETAKGWKGKIYDTIFKWFQISELKYKRTEYFLEPIL